MKVKASIKRIENDLQNLRQFGKTEQNGVTRLPFTAEDKAARDYLTQAMQAAGMQVHVDGASNVVGHLEGAKPELPILMIGSHYDTVINGGAYDGILGVVCALEAVRALQECGIKPQRSVDIIAFNDEEGTRFHRGFSGSLAMIGQLTEADLNNDKDRNGISQAELMLQHGFDPRQITSAKRQAEELFAYLELHIEQGPVLEAQGLAVGVVTAIAGATRLAVSLTGMAGHAGTVPMALRRDALAGAAECICAIEDFCRTDLGGLVGTVGYISARPGATNVIPGQVAFTIDVRAPTDAHRKLAAVSYTHLTLPTNREV